MGDRPPGDRDARRAIKILRQLKLDLTADEADARPRRTDRRWSAAVDTAGAGSTIGGAIYALAALDWTGLGIGTLGLLALGGNYLAKRRDQSRLRERRAAQRVRLDQIQDAIDALRRPPE
jgi:hypothetical protein